MQRPTFSQFPAQGYSYSANPYTPQHPPYNGAVQYSVAPQDHGPIYPNIPPATAQPLNTSIAAPPVQQIQHTTPVSRRNGRQSVASAVNQTTETQPAGADSPGGSQYGDETLTSTFHGQEQDDGHHENEQDDDPIFHLPPPPEATYDTVDELDRALHAWSLEHGYELVRRASKKNAKGILYKRYYHCSKHGKLANTGKLTEATRVRVNRKSNRINCPMSLAVVAVDPTNPDGQWQIRHRKTHHNHGPLDALALAGHRRRARMGGVEKAVDGLFAIGTPTTQVLQFLQRTNPNGLFTRTDVANMKLKYKKYGTCIDRRDAVQPEVRPGLATACQSCRTRKIKCDSQRPVCGNCVQANQLCDYIHEATDPHVTQQETSNMSSIEPPLQQAPIPQHSAHPSTSAPSSHARQEAILAELQSFTEAHVKPARLTLQSSAVEILAASSCGNGDSYRAIANLEQVEQWPSFCNAISDASMKENTFEVLLGIKLEPAKPADDCAIEEWNEYIKQLAIYNRRNTALLGAILPRLAPQFRHRVQHVRQAFAIWQVLEELCQPRGSETAYRAYLDLHAITLQNSKDIKDYIMRLEAAFNTLNRVTHTPSELAGDHARRHLQQLEPPRSMSGTQWSAAGVLPVSNRRGVASNVFTEEMLSFLFLRNLGPEYKRLADNLCSTSNIGGFGTGRRLGFADLTRSAIEYHAMQSRRQDTT